MNRKLIFTLLFLLCTAAIIVIASLPNVGKMPFSNFDKLVHFAEFFILTLILGNSILLYNPKNKALLLFAISFGIAIISELIQLPIKTRSFSYYDLLADLAGIALAYALQCKSYRQ